MSLDRLLLRNGASGLIYFIHGKYDGVSNTQTPFLPAYYDPCSAGGVVGLVGNPEQSQGSIGYSLQRHPGKCWPERLQAAATQHFGVVLQQMANNHLCVD